MNKKGISGVFLGIMAFAIVSMIFVFSATLLKESATEYLIVPEAEIATDILNDTTNLPDELGIDSIETLKNQWLNYNVPIDLTFLAMWVTLFGSTIYMTFKAGKEGVFSFMGNMLIGTMLLLLITTFLADITSWFMAEIFFMLFNDVSLNLTIFTFYINNLGIIHFVWWLVLVLVSVIDRQFISRTGRVEE
jgi:hypothetical protein